MRETLIVLNELEAAGLYRRYAIGGAMAAMFYMEAFLTEDLDIFILLGGDASKLAPLSGIYEELHKRGFQSKAEHVIIRGVPVQFLVAYNALVEEAVEHAVELHVEDIKTKVPPPEYLAAIMLQTGRQKDRARFEQMRAEVAMDNERLMAIIKNHQLTERFRQWTSN